jgi:mannose-1-phosphate guanylyltransferase/mannose-6-phosphate isomerase
LAAPIAVVNEEHRFLAAEQMREIGCTPQAIVLEPEGRNTAPAACAAAIMSLDISPDAILVVLPSDHAIDGEEQFQTAVHRAVELAAENHLVVFGINPSSPHTGYGYIRRGRACGEGTFVVERFIEKPDFARSRAFLDEGSYFWNSGIFVFRATRYLAELERHRPEILKSVERSLAGAQRDLDFVRLNAESFRACPSDSIDYAVMENASDAYVVEAGFRWSDVGSWAALWEIGARDAHGNVVHGDVLADGTRNSYLYSDGRLLAAVGVENLIVVETTDAVLVAGRDRAEEVKKMVERLRLALRAEHAVHRRVYRPWGYYEWIDGGERYQVKRLMLKPAARISLQRHRQRAEHWVVVSGTARVTRGQRAFDLGPNESTYIPKGERHRLENVGKTPLTVIEVQSGEYFGEDDIERFADDYQRD